MSSASGSKTGWIIVGGIALACAFAYCIWKLNQLCDNVQEIADNQNHRHIPNTDEPIDVSPETMTETMVPSTVSTSIVSTEAPKTVVEKPRTLDFRHSDDFRTIHHNGQEYYLTLNQARIVERLLIAHQNKTPEMHQSTLLERLEIYSKRVRDVFKNSSALGTLVIKGERRGHFRLNLGS